MISRLLSSVSLVVLTIVVAAYLIVDIPRLGMGDEAITFLSWLAEGTFAAFGMLVLTAILRVLGK